MVGNANYFSSIYREDRWRLAIGTYFSKDHHVLHIDLETTKCVFRVPEPSPCPRRLGLGPYHHLRPEFFSMQLHKISRVRRFLGPPENLEVFKEVVGALVRFEPFIRACYDEYLEFDIKTLATILTVDALYLLHYFFHDQIAENAGDILMLENQIPFVLLNLILKILQRHEIVIGDGDDIAPERVLLKKFQHFCEAHSPLELDKVTRSNPHRKKHGHLHLLDCMYDSIVMNRGDGTYEVDSMGVGFADNVATILGFFGLQTAAPAQILEIVKRAKEIRDQLSGGGSEESGGVAASGNTTPTASELSKSAGVRFERTRGGIKDTMYRVDAKIMELTRIRVDANSESLLRNLVAYEAASVGSGGVIEGALRWLAEYVDLLCGLIRTYEDVQILKKAEIIAGELSDEEIVGVFDGIRKSAAGIRHHDWKSNVGEEVSKSYDAVWSVKVRKFVMKGLSVSWKFITLVFAVAALLILLLQAFCSVFACNRWFRTQANFPFLYADQ